MSYQDWKPVILRKDNVRKDNVTKHRKKIKPINDINNIEYKPKDNVSYSLRIKIQKARQSKKMSQKELANKCNIPLSKIKQYESGGIIPVSKELQKMSLILNTKL